MRYLEKCQKVNSIVLKRPKIRKKDFYGISWYSSDTKNVKREERKYKELQRNLKCSTEENQSKVSGCFSILNDSSEDSNSSESPDILEASTRKWSQMRLRLPSLALACDRSEAMIASEVLEDIGIIS